MALNNRVSDFLYVFGVAFLGLISSVFTVFYLKTFNTGIIKDFYDLIASILLSGIFIISVLAFIFCGYDKKIAKKLIFSVLFLISLASILMFYLEKSGFLSKVTSVEAFRSYIDSFGGNAVILFITLQFLQVVVLPIPGFITVGAGVLLFGAIKGAFYSYLGIVFGSITAYFFGRIFGYKAVKWLIGEQNLKKGLKTIKGKDKVILTFMFLFPFFPDDILCFIAGITTIKPKTFILMVLITRFISIFVSSFSLNNSIIPYDTWWGIIIWIIVFSLIVILTIVVYKKGDLIEEKLLKIKRK